MKNYAGRGECYQPRWITASEISVILHIIIRKPNPRIALLFIQNICKFLTRAYLFVDFLQTFACFSVWFQDINKYIFADTTEKIDNIYFTIIPRGRVGYEMER